LIDARSFAVMLDAGEFDACLSHLRQNDHRAAADAGGVCRLAEALFHRGRRDEAVECCRRELPGVDGDAALLRICAWVFSNSGCHDEAASAYRALLALHPDWAEGYRHLSGSLAAAGRREEALAPALSAAALSTADDGGAAMHAAELLMQCGRPDEAAAVLDRAAAHAAADPQLLRVLSAAEMLRGRLEAALAAVERALAAAPDNAEYHVHRGHLLWRLGDTAGAAAAFRRALALDPASDTVRRAQLSLYLAAGLVSEATAVGGELLHRFPDDRPAAQAVLHLLNHRLDTIDGDYVVLEGGEARRPRQPRPAPGPFERWRNQRRVVAALILRETRTRFADLKLGYAWALIEPILHIALLSVMFAVLMHGRPPIGKQFFIFYYTGLIRYSGADGTKCRFGAWAAR
jgi:tetratricopeptide (TPR) repeat protein